MIGPLRDSDKIPTIRGSVDAPERIKDRSDGLTPRLHERRRKIDRRIADFPLESPNENIGPQTAVGFAITQAIAATNDYVPGDIGADTEISDVTRIDDRTIRYKINVDAPLMSQAKAEAVMEASTGLTGVWTDTIEVEEVDLVNKRTVRDTWQYTITVTE